MYTVLNFDTSCNFTSWPPFPQKGSPPPPGTNLAADLFVPNKAQIVPGGYRSWTAERHQAHSLVTVLTELPRFLFFDMRTIH